MNNYNDNSNNPLLSIPFLSTEISWHTYYRTLYTEELEQYKQRLLTVKKRYETKEEQYNQLKRSNVALDTQITNTVQQTEVFRQEQQLLRQQSKDLVQEHQNLSTQLHHGKDLLVQLLKELEGLNSSIEKHKLIYHTLNRGKKG